MMSCKTWVHHGHGCLLLSPVRYLIQGLINHKSLALSLNLLLNDTASCLFLPLLSHQLLLQPCVPVILDIIVGSSRFGLDQLPASNTEVQAADDIFFIFSEPSMLDIRSEIIQPSKSAAFSTSLKA